MAWVPVRAKVIGTSSPTCHPWRSATLSRTSTLSSSSRRRAAVGGRVQLVGIGDRLGVDRHQGPGPALEAPLPGPDLRHLGHLLGLAQGVADGGRDAALGAGHRPGRDHEVGPQGVLDGVAGRALDGGGQDGDHPDQGDPDHEGGGGGRRAAGVAHGVLPAEDGGLAEDADQGEAEQAGGGAGDERGEHGDADEDAGRAQPDGQQRRLHLPEQADEEGAQADDGDAQRRRPCGGRSPPAPPRCGPGWQPWARPWWPGGRG